MIVAAVTDSSSRLTEARKAHFSEQAPLIPRAASVRACVKRSPWFGAWLVRLARLLERRLPLRHIVTRPSYPAET